MSVSSGQPKLSASCIWEQGSTVPVGIFGKFETKRKKEQKSQSECRDFIILKQWKKALTSEDP